MKNLFVGIGIAVLLALAIFFFYIVPEQKKIEGKINDAYKQGFADCSNDIDTVFLPGKEKIVYKDTSFHQNKPVTVAQEDTSFSLISSGDTNFVSGKDEISVQATSISKVELKDGRPVLNDIPDAKWFFRIQHKGFEMQPDTIKLEVPKLVEKVIEETNWLYVLLGYIGGALTALFIFLSS